MPRLFGAKLALVRTRAGITQTALAQRIPIRQSHISHLEAGRKAPTVDLVVLLTWVFHVSPDYFLQDSIEIEPIPKIAVPVSWQGDLLRLGEKIQHLRIKRGWSQFELGEHLGLRGQGFVSAIELARKLPSVDLLLRMVEVFDLPADILLLDWLDLFG
ncbi:MAG: helix-turn-helix transcriptional regulator [Herpetosiphonaceae bacterium]|nr:helix-turn-helix transcriptional regulator [Herpetosiphonaceae bacterium]